MNQINSINQAHWLRCAWVVILFALAACAPAANLPTPTSAPTVTRTTLATTVPAQVFSPTPAPTIATTVTTQTVISPPNCEHGTTPSQTEGPFYKANTPQRASLIQPGMTGTRVILTGYVLTRSCKPIAGAWLDFWQADDRGAYDNSGYTLRGHQFTDANGRYSLETVLPGLYTGRTRHIHVKAQAPNQPILTT